MKFDKFTLIEGVFFLVLSSLIFIPSLLKAKIPFFIQSCNACEEFSNCVNDFINTIEWIRNGCCDETCTIELFVEGDGNFCTVRSSVKIIDDNGVVYHNDMPDPKYPNYFVHNQAGNIFVRDIPLNPCIPKDANFSNYLSDVLIQVCYQPWDPACDYPKSPIFEVNMWRYIFNNIDYFRNLRPDPTDCKFKIQIKATEEYLQFITCKQCCPL